MCTLKAPFSQTIEIPVAANQQTVNIPDQPQLRDKEILAVQLVTPDVAALSPVSFQTPVPVASLQRCYLELWDGNLITFRRVPILLLNNVQGTAGVPFVRDLWTIEPQVISWTKSQLVFGTAPVAAGVVTLNVYYR